MDKKIGLILAGGANRGVFTAGVLDFFQKHNVYTPYVISVSVGSCNALDYVSRQIGRTKNCRIPNGRNVPPINWRHFFKIGTIIDLDMVFNEYPNRIVPFDYGSYASSDTESEYVVTNCYNGKAEYLSDRDNKKRLMSICRASCSMPYILPVCYVDDKPYLDGGISDPIPVKHSMDLGYEKNIVILTRPIVELRNDVSFLHLLNRVMYKKKIPKSCRTVR